MNGIICWFVFLRLMSQVDLYRYSPFHSKSNNKIVLKLERLGMIQTCFDFRRICYATKRKKIMDNKALGPFVLKWDTRPLLEQKTEAHETAALHILFPFVSLSFMRAQIVAWRERELYYPFLYWENEPKKRVVGYPHCITLENWLFVLACAIWRQTNIGGNQTGDQGFLPPKSNFNGDIFQLLLRGLFSMAF